MFVLKNGTDYSLFDKKLITGIFTRQLIEPADYFHPQSMVMFHSQRHYELCSLYMEQSIKS